MIYCMADLHGEQDFFMRMLEQRLPLKNSQPGVEVVYRGEGEDQIRMILNHNAWEVGYEGEILAPFQCVIQPVSSIQ